jgi:hypothetical protein
MKSYAAILTVALALLGGAAAFAGEGNVLYLTQQGGGDNTFQSDQSQGAYTTITATQNGTFNDANATLSGNCTFAPQPCGTFSLSQDNSASLVPAGNSATATLTGTANGGITQGSGGGNTATLLLLGAGDGSITQEGSGNTAKLSVLESASGDIQQNGSGNVANLQVSGAVGTGYSLVQNGSALQMGDANTPLQISTTNPGITTVTQY